jgi:hypothetical protein
MQVRDSASGEEGFLHVCSRRGIGNEQLQPLGVGLFLFARSWPAPFFWKYVAPVGTPDDRALRRENMYFEFAWLLRPVSASRPTDLQYLPDVAMDAPEPLAPTRKRQRPSKVYHDNKRPRSE